MMRYHKPYSIYAAAVLLLLTGSAASYAHGGSIESNVEAVTRFLHLSPGQVGVFQNLLQERQMATTPIREEVAVLEKQLEGLIATGENPAAIGLTVLNIHERRQVIEMIQAEFLVNFQGHLTDTQRHRLARLRQAARLQPVLPAFVHLGLL